MDTGFSVVRLKFPVARRGNGGKRGKFNERRIETKYPGDVTKSILKENRDSYIWQRSISERRLDERAAKGFALEKGQKSGPPSGAVLLKQKDPPLSTCQARVKFNRKKSPVNFVAINERALIVFNPPWENEWAIIRFVTDSIVF